MTMNPSSLLLGRNIPGPAVLGHVGTARLLETVDRRTTVVGRDFRLPCSDSDDDVLYAEGHDREVRQINLRNEWSVDSWTADDSCGEGCAQLDDFNWFLPAHDRVGDLPAPESQVDLSDSESDVDDVEPDSVPVQMTTTAVESLCPPVVAQTRPKEGCDPASPRRLRRGCDVLMEDSKVAVDSRRISIAPDTDVVPDLVPVQMATMAVESLCPPVVTQMRPKEGCDPDLPRQFVLGFFCAHCLG